jgi:tetratricopeptide (TPR) repeat protein
MRANPKKLLAAAICLCFVAAGANGANRLAFADARAEALAKGPALAAGFYSLGTNPAALADLPSLQFGFTHKALAAPNSTSEIVGGGIPLGKYGTFAGGFGTVLVNNVEVYDKEGRGGDTTYMYHDDRLSLGYAVSAVRWLAVGAALNYDRHKVDPLGERDYQTLGGDVGAYARTPEIVGGPLTLGVSAENLIAAARATSTPGDDYREPLRVNLGAAWARYFGNHRLTLAFSGPAQEPVNLGLGVEVLISSMFAARGGFMGSRPERGSASVRPNGGLGFNTDLFSFDYCYLNRELGSYHYLSFSLNPGRESRTLEEKRRQAAEWLAEGLAYFDAGNYERAAERFAAVLKWDPGNDVAREHQVKAEYYVNLAEGDEFLKTQDWKQARHAFDNALALVPGDFLATEYLERVNQLEAEEAARIAEEKRVAEKLSQARAANDRGAYLEAIKLSEELLAAYPDNEEAAELLDEARRLLAVRIAKLPPEERTGIETETAVKTSVIPPEVVKRYRQGNALLSQGALGQAITVLADIVNEYPTYGAARSKLVEAYLYQGLDLYSKGSSLAALKAWKRALAIDPTNAKAKRYIGKVEAEIK